MRSPLLAAVSLIALIGCGSSSSGSDEHTGASDAGSDAQVVDQDATGPDAADDSPQTIAEAGPNDSAAPPGPDAAPPSKEVLDFLHQWFEKQCSAMADCCDGAGLGYDEAACVDDMLSAIVNILPSNVTLNSDRVDACLSAVSEFYAICTPEGPFGFDSEVEQEVGYLCGGVIEGSAKPGESCSTILDCSTTPDGQTTCAHNHCQWILAAKEGEACEIISQASITNWCPMSAGLYCHEDGTCKPIGNPGDPCGTNTPLSCYDGMCSSGTHTCPAVPGLGDDCGPGIAECPWDMRCSTATSKCVAAGNAGDACSDDIECKSVTCVAGRCSTVHHNMYGAIRKCAPPN